MTSSLFNLIVGLKHVDVDALAEYECGMTEAIPNIIRDVENRRMLAIEARYRRSEIPETELIPCHHQP